VSEPTGQNGVAGRVVTAVVGPFVSPVVDRVDVNELMDRVDVNELMDRVNVNALLDRVEVDALLDRVDVNALLDRVDVDRLLARVDVDALVERTELGNIIARSTSGAAGRMLDVARSAVVTFDLAFHGVVDRLLRRHGEPVSAPLLIREREQEAT
jgi:hypothetical protein